MRRTVFQEQNRIHLGPGAASAGAIRFLVPARLIEGRIRTSRHDYSTILQGEAQPALFPCFDSTKGQARRALPILILARGEK